MWWNRIRDRLTGGYQPWGRLLDIVERQRVQLSFQYLPRVPKVDGANLDLPWLSQELWCFLGPRPGEQPYARRVQLAGGEERNGLELWRRLHMTNGGGAEQVALAGLRRLHRFAPCPSKEKLGHYLGTGNFSVTNTATTSPTSPYGPCSSQSCQRMCRRRFEIANITVTRRKKFWTT